MTYCICGHREEEHRAYEWSGRRKYCRGHSVAYDADAEGHQADHRFVYCPCTGFHAADEHLLSEWREAGNLREEAAA